MGKPRTRRVRFLREIEDQIWMIVEAHFNKDDEPVRYKAYNQSLDEIKKKDKKKKMSKVRMFTPNEIGAPPTEQELSEDKQRFKKEEKGEVK